MAAVGDIDLIAWRTAQAMALDLEVFLDLRSRPRRTVRGRITHRVIDRRKRLDSKSDRERSNLVVTVRRDDGSAEDVDVERIGAIRSVRRAEAAG